MDELAGLREQAARTQARLDECQDASRRQAVVTTELAHTLGRIIHTFRNFERCRAGPSSSAAWAALVAEVEEAERQCRMVLPVRDT